MKMIRVSDATHQRIQLLAAVRKVSMTQVVDQGINATLNASEVAAMRALMATQEPRTPERTEEQNADHQ